MKKLLFILVFAFGVSSQVGAQLLFNFVNLTVGLIQTANEGGYEGQVTLFNYSPCYVHGIRAGWHPGDHFSMGYSIHYSNNTVPNIAKNQFGQSQNFKLYQIETGMYFEYVSNRTANKYWSIPVNLNYGGFFIPDEYVPVNYPGSTSYFSI